SIFKLKNYKGTTIIGYKSNKQVIFDLYEISHSNSFFELIVLKKGLISFNYTFRKKPEAFNFIDKDEIYEYVLRVHNNHSISIGKREKHYSILSLDYVKNKLVILYKAPYINEKIFSELTLQSINSDVIKQFKTNKLGENVYKTIIN